jgi:histidinol dehydrogenase
MLRFSKGFEQNLKLLSEISIRAFVDDVETGEEVAKTIRKIVSDISEVDNISDFRDKAIPWEIPREEWEAAAKKCDPIILEDLRRAAKNIEEYQKNLLPNGGEWDTPDGGKAGVLVRPVQRAGLYVPGGTSAYPSTVLMTAIPARVAGVGEVIICTPPGEQLKPEVLAAALICGVDRVFALGGVPAIVCMALGANVRPEFKIPRCDVVAGPGNKYVTEAKRQVSGVCGIDSTAGPSDILVLCDRTANPAWVAADLLSQAEHGERSRAVLVSMDEAVAKAVCAKLESQVADLPRREEAEAALRDYSAAFVAESKEDALQIINAVAPEHLEIITENPESWLDGIQNAGAVFLGPYSPEPLGDYWAGPSHVLPTEGSARFFSPVSVETFLKRTSVINYSKAAFEPVIDSIARLARAEGLEAHARSAEARMVDSGQLRMES